MWHVSKRLAVVLVLGLLALLVQPARAQTELERFERQLERIQRETRLVPNPDVPAEQRLLVDYGAYVIFGFLSVDDSAGENHVLRQGELNGYLRINLDNIHEVFVRARTVYRDFRGDDSFNGSGDDWVEPTLDRAFYRFDLARYLAVHEDRVIDWDLSIQGGRQLVHWANGLVLSEELDGGVINFAKGDFALDLVAAITRDSVTDIDSSRPDYNDNTRRGFYGAMLSYQATPRHRPFLYGLVQDDNNNESDAATGTEFEYNSWYVGFGSRGNLSDRLLYGVEAAYEGGETYSDSSGGVGTQTRDDISAFAGDVQLDYLFNDDNHSRLTGEVILATGDGDRQTTTNTIGGNAPGTTDHAFNSFGLLNTGLAFSPNISNLLVFRLGASTFPLPRTKWFDRMQIGANLFVINKFSRGAPIDEPTDDGTFLGVEPDLFVNWQITSDVSLAVRYGVFIPSDNIQGSHEARQFFYTGLTVAF